MVSQSFRVNGGKVGLGVGVFETLKVDLTVVLGRARMPLHMLLRMGRGAVIALDASDSDMVEILANDHPVARGQIVVTGDRISVEVTELIRKEAAIIDPTVTIGDGAARSSTTRWAADGKQATFACRRGSDLLSPAAPDETAPHGAQDDGVSGQTLPPVRCGHGGIGRRASLRC